MKWKKITGEIKRTVLVTNNLKAIDAFGRMSHVWLAEYVHKGPAHDVHGKNIATDGEYFLLDYPQPRFLTHYCEIPQVRSDRDRKRQYIQQRTIRKNQGEDVKNYKKFV